jgi:starvation-inducible DNA-binding protein
MLDDVKNVNSTKISANDRKRWEGASLRLSPKMSKAMSDSRGRLQHDLPGIPAGSFPTDETIVLLDTLLTLTIPVRDLYKSACCQASGRPLRHLRPLLDTHHEDQSRLIEALVDRICALGGAQNVLVGSLRQSNQFTDPLRCHLAPNRLLCDLLDAHELVLTAAQTAVPGSLQTAACPDRDLVVGRVVLTNDLHDYALREQLILLDETSAP